MSDSVSDDILRNGFERWQRLEGEKQAISDDLKELFFELKGHGFDGKALRAAFRAVAKIDDADVQEHNAVVDLYVSSLTAARSGTVPATRIRAAREEKSDRIRITKFDDGSADYEEIDGDTGEVLNSKTYEPQPAQAAAQTGAVEVERSTADSGLTLLVESEVVAISTPIQPETANDKPEEAELLTSDPQRSVVVTREDTRSAVSGDGGAGKSAGGRASAALPVEYAAPGVITTEHTPPEPVKRHPYSLAFGETGQDITQLRKEIHAKFGGVTEPIVKIGPSILSGWARYNISRSMMIDYPVVQYGGTDALADVIAWNLESRSLTPADRRAIAARLAKLHPERSDEINDLMGVAETIEAVA